MKPLPEHITHFHPNIDLKCTTCQFYQDATGIQIWCDKLGLNALPTRSCNKYRKAKKPYTVVVNNNMVTPFLNMVGPMAKTNKVIYVAVEMGDEKIKHKFILKGENE